MKNQKRTNSVKTYKAVLKHLPNDFFDFSNLFLIFIIILKWSTCINKSSKIIGSWHFLQCQIQEFPKLGVPILRFSPFVGKVGNFESNHDYARPILACIENNSTEWAVSPHPKVWKSNFPMNFPTKIHRK